VDTPFRPNNGVSTKPGQLQTVDELLDALVADYRLRGVKSLPQCLSHAKHVRAHFGRWRAVEITPEKIDAYCEQRLAAGATSATVNRETQLFAHAFTLAHERGTVATMPKFRRLAERNVRKGFFEADEFATVVDALPDYLQDVARFAYLTGWRRSEILRLTWADVDLTGGVIRLSDTKNGHGRALVMAGDLRAILTRREQARLLTTNTGDVRVVDLVFHHGGKPIVDYRKAWATACRAAGFGSRVVNPKTGRRELERRLHDFRRTAARNMVRQGTPERVAMEVTGHRTRSMFDRYSIVSEGDLRAAMARATLPVAAEQATR
jgi:integrase